MPGEGTIQINFKREPNGGISSGARNGLTVVAGFVELGGANPLIQNTVIDVAGFEFNVRNGATEYIQVIPGTNESAFGSQNDTFFSLQDGLRVLGFANAVKLFQLENNGGLLGDIDNGTNGILVEVDNVSGGVLFKEGGNLGTNFLEFNGINRQYEYGDMAALGNGCIVRLDDPTQVLSFSANGNEGMNLDLNNVVFQIGDIGGVGGSQIFEINDGGFSFTFRRGATTWLSMTGGDLTILSNNGRLIATTTALTNGAGAAAGTLLNAPAAGDPTKWIPINDGGTVRHIPAW